MNHYIVIISIYTTDVVFNSDNTKIITKISKANVYQKKIIILIWIILYRVKINIGIFDIVGNVKIFNNFKNKM